MTTLVTTSPSHPCILFPSEHVGSTPPPPTSSETHRSTRIAGLSTAPTMTHPADGVVGQSRAPPMHPNEADLPPITRQNAQEGEEKLRELREKRMAEFSDVTSHLCGRKLADEEWSAFEAQVNRLVEDLSQIVTSHPPRNPTTHWRRRRRCANNQPGEPTSRPTTRPRRGGKRPGQSTRQPPQAKRDSPSPSPPQLLQNDSPDHAPRRSVEVSEDTRVAVLQCVEDLIRYGQVRWLQAYLRDEASDRRLHGGDMGGHTSDWCHG